QDTGNRMGSKHERYNSSGVDSLPQVVRPCENEQKTVRHWGVRTVSVSPIVPHHRALGSPNCDTVAPECKQEEAMSTNSEIPFEKMHGSGNDFVVVQQDVLNEHVVDVP